MIGLGIVVYLIAKTGPERKSSTKDFVTPVSLTSSRVRVNTTHAFITITLGIVLLVLFNVEWLGSLFQIRKIATNP